MECFISKYRNVNNMHGIVNQKVIEGNKKHEHRELYFVNGRLDVAFWRGTFYKNVP